MQILQKTLKRSYTFEGKGLHTGKVARMTVCPAPEDYGVKFIRTDISADAVIEASAVCVSNTARSTTLSCGDASVITIEHIMSALTGLGVDNARIEIDNVEVPILDGSAKPYVDAICADGLEVQNAERKYVEVKETVYLEKDNGTFIRIEPADQPSFDLTIDFNSRVLGVQTAHWDESVAYEKEIGTCRTFVFFHELEFLYKNNLVKGGDVDNAIVIVEHPVTPEQVQSMSELFGIPALEVKENGYLNNLELRFPNECARHKMLDLMGDLRLCGGFLKAKVTAAKVGHGINTQAAKMIINQQ